MVHVELVYIALDGALFQKHMDLVEGARVADVLAQSGLYAIHPEAQGMALGIFSKNVTPDTVLKDGDRVELYRPLSYDPKENRKKKARIKKSRV